MIEHDRNEYEGDPIKLLDHGHLRLVEHWGADSAIIRAARQSTAKGFQEWGRGWACSRGLCDWQDPDFVGHRHSGCPKCGTTEIVERVGDERLLGFLWKNKHSTPFEVAGVTIEVQAPIMVFREWHRHRVPFGYSEMSARYVPLPNENYVPTVARLVGDGAKDANRQAGTAKGVERCDAPQAESWLEMLADGYDHCESVYQSGLALGVPKELARCILPVGRYSRMWATGNLRGWLGFLALREAKGAQEEIRVYAHALANELRRVFPRTMNLYSVA